MESFKHCFSVLFGPLPKKRGLISTSSFLVYPLSWLKFFCEVFLVHLQFLRYIFVIIHVAGFQTVAIFMQSGTSEKTKAAGDSIVEVAISDIVKDSLHKV